MKIAVLISGEYRTFPICRKTMTFLDDPRVDIYFSTWDKTIIKNERLGIDINEAVTEERVRNDLGKEAVVLVEQVDCFEERLYNSKMIHRWCSGFQLIKNSGKQYDHVMVMRPDLFFNVANNFSLETLTEIKDEFRIAWFSPGILLQDNMWAAAYSKTEELFSKLTVDTWTTETVELDWHQWWTSFINRMFAQSKDLIAWEQVSFCRPLARAGDDWYTVRRAEDVWRDTTILNQIAEHSRELAIQLWTVGTVEKAEERYKSGYYEQFKKPRVAIIISGMLRNYDAAVLSLPIWENADRFLICWQSAGIDAIDDYKRRALIKNAFVIEDSDIDTIYQPPFNMNAMRMLYLWQQAYKLIPKIYDKYVIIRPDGFYWTCDTSALQNVIYSSTGINVPDGAPENSKVICDHMLFMDKDGFSVLADIFSDMIPILNNRLKSRDTICIHYMLQEFFNNKGLNPKRQLIDDTVHVLFVRDTFKLYPQDKYGLELYREIFYDTASWYRRNHGIVYGGKLPHYIT